MGGIPMADFPEDFGKKPPISTVYDVSTDEDID